MRQFKPGQLQTGSIYPITSSFALTASYTLGLDTGSLTTTASFNAFTSSYYADSSSFQARITDLENFSASLDATYATDTELNAATASLSASISNLSSSFEIFSGSYNTGSFTGSFIGSLHGTASYALSSSYALTASYVTPLQQNVIITGSIYIPDNTHGVYFSGSNAASRLTWNDTDGTLDLGLKGGNVTLQIGQEEVIRVVNKTGADLLESQYKVVRVRSVSEGGAQGQRLAVVLAQANNDANSATTIGIVTENITNNQEGFITTFGLIRGINTTGTLQGETWTDGDMLYLSPTDSGTITNIKPQGPNHTVILGYVVYAHNNQGKIFVKVDNGYEIDELHNVKITTASLAAGQLLVRSGSNSSGVWINTNQLTGSYGLTGSLNASAITGSFTGSFTGDGSQLTGIVSSKWTGSNPISRQSDVEITGSLRTRNTLGTGINTDLGQLLYIDTVSVDWKNAYLKDQNDVTSIDWQLRKGNDSFGIRSFNWDSRYTSDSNGNVSIDWEIRQLLNSNEDTVLDWENGLFTGSIHGTASWANNAVTASFITIAQTASYVLNAVSASFATSASTAISASFATSASQAISASFAQTASKSTIQILTGADTRSFALTMVESNTSTSLNNPARIAIHTGTPLTYTVAGGVGGILNTTASFATSASYAQTSSIADSASFATSASYAESALTASYATYAATAETIPATIQEINLGTDTTNVVQTKNLEQSKHTTINIYNSLNFI